MDEKMTEWRKYETVNSVLLKDFLCLPPYESVTCEFLHDAYAFIVDREKLRGKITQVVLSPWQRAFQMEYCYKECEIFARYIHLIEYATYDAMAGNWVCAYVSMVPLIEAIMHNWWKETHGLELKKVYKAADIIASITVYEDDRKTITDEHIKYLKFIFEKLFYIKFDEYTGKNYKDVFNRQLTLHRLEGISSIEEGMHNLTRIFLILDLIAELYLMQDENRYKAFWEKTFYADYVNGEIDFNLRWQLYINLSMQAVGSSELHIMENCFLSRYVSAEEKRDALKLMKIKNGQL